MNLAFLKKIRVVISLLFFVALTLLFIDVGHFLQIVLSGPAQFLQFIPSILKFITLLSISSIGFIVILVLTALFGRVYCSFLCPLGTLQDLIIYLNRRVRKIFKWKRLRFEYSKPYNFFRYSILVLTIISLLAGTTFIDNLIDPYSLYGKIFTVFIRHSAVQIHNTTAWLLESIGFWYLYPVDLKPFNYPLVIFVSCMSLLVIWFSIKYGRLYCNTICPVGSFLGFISKYSIFKIVFNESSCTNCGLCERICKSECIDYENHYIDESRCVGCFNCFDSCPEKGFTYKLSVTNKSSKTDLPKRGFLLKTAVAGTALTLSSCEKKTGHETNKYYQTPKIASPPGSRSIKNLTDKCTACQLCTAVCPTQVLQPSIFEYGMTTIFQPVMDYPLSFCNYECIACTQVCPTGAILPLTVEQKKLTQIGTAKLIKDLCVVFVNKKDCGACSEQCPTKAVFMIPYENNLSAPEINNDICVGCGACEHSCPTKPYKAIYVEGSPEHKKAQKPKTKKLEAPPKNQEDFPF